MRHGQDFVFHYEIHGGHISYIAKIELYFCDMLITLSKIRLDLNPTEYIELINALIKGTPHKHFLIESKKKNSHHQIESNKGEIGEKYFL